MDRERAEAHLRMLAETELRRVTPHPAGSARVARVAQVLTAVGALDDKVATQIADNFELALCVRDPALRRYLGQRSAAWLPGPARTPRPNAAGGRVVPLGMRVPVRAEGVSGEINLLSFVRYRTGRVLRPADGPGYLMATALAGEPIPPGAFSGALTRNIS
jgi:hypothetical protein